MKVRSPIVYQYNWAVIGEQASGITIGGRSHGQGAGLIWAQMSALAAVVVRRGSMTISLASFPMGADELASAHTVRGVGLGDVAAPDHYGPGIDSAEAADGELPAGELGGLHPGVVADVGAAPLIGGAEGIGKSDAEGPIGPAGAPG